MDINQEITQSLSVYKISFDKLLPYQYTVKVMKRGTLQYLFALSCMLLLLTSCVTQREAIEPEPVSPQEEQEQEPEVFPEETAAAEDPEPALETDEEPQLTEEAEFSVSEEVFTETFEDVRRLIDELNAIIRDENYTKWLRFLTDEYIAHFSSAEVLKENSEQPLLKKYDIELLSLRDYFNYVVVPSRSNVRLDDLVFVDNEHVKAIMIFSGKRTILYLLEKSAEGWKIGL